MSSVPYDNEENEENAESGSVDDSGMRMLPKKIAQATPSAPLQERTGDFETHTRNDASESQAGQYRSPNENVVHLQNIPLMRIVMSKKQTKRPSAKVLKEGWLVHFTDQNNMVQLMSPS
jgi:hypothetical protein